MKKLSAIASILIITVLVVIAFPRLKRHFIIQAKPPDYDGENLYYVIEFVPHEVDLSTFALEVELVTKKIWVDPRLDFSAVKSEFAFYIKAKRILKERTEFKAYRRFPSDIWYPTSVHCDTYHPITRKILTQFSYHLLEADFTNDIPDDFFDVSRDDIGILVSDIW